MTKPQCKEAMAAYRKFITRQEPVHKFLQLAEVRYSTPDSLFPITLSPPSPPLLPPFSFPIPPLPRSLPPSLPPSPPYRMLEWTSRVISIFARSQLTSYQLWSLTFLTWTPSRRLQMLSLG